MTVEEKNNIGYKEEEQVPFGICTGTYKNMPGAIPEIRFIENVEEFMKQPNATIEAVLKVMQTVLNKLKFYEKHIIQRKSVIFAKIPETKQSLEALEALMRSNGKIDLNFCLSDNVYASCEIAENNDTVGLWLGANVMLEYTYEEAYNMLKNNLLKGERRTEELNEELAFVKTQITTAEVTMARIYNYDVKIRREEKEKISK